MNRFSVYIWMDGRRFDADRFHSGIAKNLMGEVKLRNRGNGKNVEEAGKCWRSETISPAEDRVEEELLALVLRYKAEIRRARKLGATRVFAQVVGYMADIDHLRGYYLSKEILHVLAGLGMELDIDIVRELKIDGRRNKC